MAKTFRVYPGGVPGKKYRYFKVVIYSSHLKMYHGYKRRSCGRERTDFAAIVMPRQVERFDKGKHTVDPFLGYILLSEECLHYEILAHEATHAATYYVKRLRKSKDEELLAWAVGKTTQELIRKCREFNV
jgi:hypothetical protein